MLSLFAFAGCDVHEFPEERNEKVPFLLHLDFNQELPLYKEVLYTRGGSAQTKSAVEKHDIRYTINVYRTDNTRADNRQADTTYIFTKSDLEELNYTARLDLVEGEYDFKVWADYVNAGSTEDKYYDTSNFSEIILIDRENHSGSNDYRDAFRGYASATVTNPIYYTGEIVNTIDNQATAEMKRPMGKFKFVSTDTEVFLSRVTQMMREQGLLPSVSAIPGTKEYYEQMLQSVNLGDFYIVFKYNFMPCSFNMFTDKPADAWPGMSFISRMTPETISEAGTEMNLGYDYIFVNGSGTTLSISLDVYNKDGVLMSSSNPVDVPIVRSKMTLVKGEFLTSKATGGVTINPGYDGNDYNREI